MLESPNAVRQSPPPLPKPTPPSARRDRALAATSFVADQRARLARGARRARDLVRRRPVLAGVAIAAALVAFGAGMAIALDLDLDLNPFTPTTVATARADARAHPDDGSAQRDLGHALWGARKRAAALRAYERALAIDPGVADGEVVSHLLTSFGGRHQRDAEAIIWKNKLVAAEDGLKRLVHSKAHAVRWGAVHTLDRLGKGSKAYWETAYIADLDSPRCEVRQAAVEKLGAIGTRRSIAALRAARAGDEKTGGFFRSRCLGDRLDDAEQRIVARR